MQEERGTKQSSKHFKAFWRKCNDDDGGGGGGDGDDDGDSEAEKRKE